MPRIPAFAAGLLLAVAWFSLALPAVAGAGPRLPTFATPGLGEPAYAISTGDAWLDQRVGELDTYARRYREPFIGELVALGASRELAVELLDERRWAPGDIYLLCLIASVAQQPCLEAVRAQQRSPGLGWKALAEHLGMPPGAADQDLLRHAVAATYRRLGYPIPTAGELRVEWSHGARGPGGN